MSFGHRLLATRFQRKLLYGVAAALLLLHGVTFALQGEGARRASDFSAFYTGGVLLARGEGHALYDLDRQEAVQQEAMRPVVFAAGVLPYVYPPFAAILLAPLSRLPLLAAYWWWQVVSALALLIALWLLLRAPGWRGVRKGPVLLLLLATFPVTLQFGTGQVSVVMLLALAAATAAFAAGRPALAGLLLAGLLLKPQSFPLLAVTLLVWRQWHALLGLSIGSLALGILSTWIAGWNWWDRMLALALATDRSLASGRVSEGWPALVSGLHLPAAGAVALLLAGAGVAVVAALWPPIRLPWSRLEEQWAAVIVATVFLSPHVLPHDLLLLLVPLLLLWRVRLGDPQRLRRLAWWAVAINLAMMVDALGHRFRLVPWLLLGVLVGLAAVRWKWSEVRPAQPQRAAA
jgi:hypothetical protein